MTQLATNIRQTPLHLLFTLLLAILHRIFIHLLQQADQRILHMLNHTTINPTRKNLNHICHKITNLMNLPHTLIPTSSLIQVSQRVVSHQYHHITHHTIRVLILRTPPSRPLPQAAIHQLHSTLQAA